jgi:hypothetical protein
VHVPPRQVQLRAEVHGASCIADSRRGASSQRGEAEERHAVGAAGDAISRLGWGSAAAFVPDPHPAPAGQLLLRISPLAPAVRTILPHTRPCTLLARPIAALPAGQSLRTRPTQILCTFRTPTSTSHAASSSGQPALLPQRPGRRLASSPQLPAALLLQRCSATSTRLPRRRPAPRGPPSPPRRGMMRAPRRGARS